MANDIHSTNGTSFLLSSNNDEMERDQARAAANRRKAATVPSPPSDYGLSKEQIVELFQNCIKLATENKINQKNSWDLKLIDHLSEIIKDEAGNDSVTNFQKASRTLGAGVKIYSVRVDSVHAEAYKVLGRINRAGLAEEQEITVEDSNVNSGQDRSQCKKEQEWKISPLSTLESSFEALNLNRFDVAFAEDPLYHQKSAQFDEGGARGLLLNNLGVYGGCQLLSDSSEVPGKCISCSSQQNALGLIDLLLEKELIEQMVINMLEKTEICPTLSEILCHTDEDNQRSAQASTISQNSDLPTDAFDCSEFESDSGNYDTSTIDHDDDIGVSHDNMFCGEAFQSQDNNSCTSLEDDMDGRFEKVSTYLFQGLGFPSKKNAWAGPDHWKFWRPKGSEDAPATPSHPVTKGGKSENHTEVDLDFTTRIDKEFPDIFSPPIRLKCSLLRAKNRVPGHTLPEDCHFPPDSLVKLFLLPNVLVFGKRKRNHTDHSSWEQSNHFDESLPSWNNESVAHEEYNDGCVHISVEDLDTLVSLPRKVSRIEVQYDRTSKQVDVHELKKALWDHMQESVAEMESKGNLSFRRILSTFPVNCQTTVTEDISPHLCFICLLYLANEHGLCILDCSSLDELSIHLPSRLNSSGGVVQPSS